MEDSRQTKRSLQFQQQQEPPQKKRYNTRATTSSSSCPNTINATPIRICPSAHSLHFQRLHTLFFNKADESNNDGQSNCSTGNRQKQHELDMSSNTSSTATDASVQSRQIIRFGNVRLQSIYSFPNIYIIDQFLSVNDIQYLFTHFISKFKFHRSFVDESMHDNNDDVDDNVNRYENLVDDVAGITSSSDPGKRNSNKSPYRTSAFLALNKQHDSRIASIEQKVASLFGCSSTTKQIESLQLVRYQSPDQFFHVHHDLGIYDETTGKVELPKKSIWYKRRMVTLFCYLNTVPPENGGATYFPSCTRNRSSQHLARNDKSLQTADGTISSSVDNESHPNIIRPTLNPDCQSQSTNHCCTNDFDETILCNDDGLRVYPVAGRAVVFSNVLSSGEPDSRTIHAGEPVIVSSSSRNSDGSKISIPVNLHSTEHAATEDLETDTSRVTSKYGLNIWICES